MRLTESFFLLFPFVSCSPSFNLSLSLVLLSDSCLLVQSNDKAVRVPVRECGWSKAPYLQSEHLLSLKNISKEIKLSVFLTPFQSLSLSSCLSMPRSKCDSETVSPLSYSLSGLGDTESPWPWSSRLPCMVLSGHVTAYIHCFVSCGLAAVPRLRG